jgi:hypothetical protein
MEGNLPRIETQVNGMKSKIRKPCPHEKHEWGVWETIREERCKGKQGNEGKLEKGEKTWDGFMRVRMGRVTRHTALVAKGFAFPDTNPALIVKARWFVGIVP